MSQGSRVYVTNPRLNVFDQNTERSKVILTDICNNMVTSSDFNGYMDNVIENGDDANVSLNIIKQSVLPGDAATLYDFSLNRAQLTESDTRFRIDENGRNGWKFVNDTSQAGSNIFWYSNKQPPFGSGLQLPFTFNDIDSVYCVVTTNAVEDVDQLPFLNLYSFPTGVNDGNPAFYHSRWSLAPQTQGLAYEKVLYYYGTNPAVYPELRHVPLTLVSNPPNGERLGTEVIYLMALNTGSAQPASSVDYIAQGAGFILDNGIQRSYIFDNSKVRQQQQALSSLTVTDGILQVSGGGGTGGNVTVDNFPAVQDVSNSSLSSMTFTDNTGTLYLNVHTDIPTENNALRTAIYDSAGTTALAIDPDTGAGLVEITNVPHVKLNSIVTSVNLDDSDFTATTIGGYSTSIDISNSSFQTVFGSSGLTDNSGTGSLKVEFSANNTDFFETDINFVIPETGGYFSNNGSTVTFVAPFVRFKIADHDISGLNMWVCQK
jgi:hypothetical protein